MDLGVLCLRLLSLTIVVDSGGVESYRSFLAVFKF
jgi:hypothetical protein